MSPDINMITDLFSKLHRNPEERAATLAAFRSFEPDGTIRKLSEFLRQDDRDMICDAAYLIMMINPKQGTSLILPLLKHDSGTVRSCACWLFAGYGRSFDRENGEVTKGLQNVLLTDPAEDVRLKAAYALESIGDPAALPALQHAAENDKGADWEGRTVADAARKAIERITTPPKPRWS